MRKFCRTDVVSWLGWDDCLNFSKHWSWVFIFVYLFFLAIVRIYAIRILHYYAKENEHENDRPYHKLDNHHE